MLREALENQIGRLRDYEVSAKSLIAARLDDIETNMPKLEDLRDVALVEDGEADLLQGSLDASTGTFKMKAASCLSYDGPSMPIQSPRAACLLPRNDNFQIQLAWLSGSSQDSARLTEP